MTPSDGRVEGHHEGLRHLWQETRRCWVVDLGRIPGEQPLVGELVQRWRPELWWGEGTVLPVASDDGTSRLPPPGVPLPPPPGPPPRVNVIDLGRGTVLPLVLGALVFVWPAGAGLYDGILGRPEGRLGSLLLGVVCALCVLGMAPIVWSTLKGRRLVIDDRGMRLDVGRPKPHWDLRWSEISAVAVVVQYDRGRIHWSDNWYRWLRGLPRDVAGWAIEIAPVDDAVVERHPQLRGVWLTGRRDRVWRIPISPLPRADQPTVGALVHRWQPDRWRGERAGSTHTG